MSLALTFSALRTSKPGARAVVWPRMDQKSCFKAIIAAGLTPIVVDNIVEVRFTVHSALTVISSIDGLQLWPRMFLGHCEFG